MMAVQPVVGLPSMIAKLVAPVVWQSYNGHSWLCFLAHLYHSGAFDGGLVIVMVLKTCGAEGMLRVVSMAHWGSRYRHWRPLPAGQSLVVLGFGAALKSVKDSMALQVVNSAVALSVLKKEALVWSPANAEWTAGQS